MSARTIKIPSAEDPTTVGRNPGGFDAVAAIKDHLACHADRVDAINEQPAA
jgi:uncharacterized protein (DUF427 family)